MSVWNNFFTLLAFPPPVLDVGRGGGGEWWATHMALALETAVPK